MREKIRGILELCAVGMVSYAEVKLLKLFAELEKDRERLNYLCNNTISIVISETASVYDTYINWNHIDRDIIDRAMAAEKEVPK